MTFESNIDWDERRRVILDVQAKGGTSVDAAERLGMRRDTVRRAAHQLGIPFRASNVPQIVGWDERRRVILEVQASGGTASDAAERLGLQTDTVLKTSRKLGIRFPSNNGYHGNHKRAAPVKKNAGTVAVAAQNKGAWTAYHQRRRFTKAMETAPEQPLSDAELIEQAIAEGKVTRLPPGAAIGGPSWITGDVSRCVKPRCHRRVSA